MSRSWKDAALDGPRSPKYIRSKFKYKPEGPEVNKVFVIFNEWTTIGDSVGADLVDDKFFPTESEASDALRLIAEAYDVELERDATSFVLGGNHPKGIESEEFYIRELNH